MNNITIDEQKAISSWTSPLKEYRYIKGVLKNEYNGSLKTIYKRRANCLLGLFEKYDDNTNRKIIYRGDVIESQEEYQELLSKKVGDIINLEGTMLSFTFAKEEAINAYLNSDKSKCDDTPTILWVINERHSTFLDISRFSCFPNEQEVVCNKGLNFIITKVEHQEVNHIIHYLNELNSKI